MYYNGEDFATLYNKIPAELRSVANGLKDWAIEESWQVVGPVKFRGVDVYFLDLSTLSETGTFKDWAALLTVGYCKTNNIDKFITQSSGNTANSIIRYSTCYDLPAVALYPSLSRYKIISRDYSPPSALIEVSATEKEIKRLTQTIAFKCSVQWFPSLPIQLEANSVRSLLLDDVYLNHGLSFDWHSQSISSAYGVLGLHYGISKYGFLAPKRPKLLCVQQEAVAPYFVDIKGETNSQCELIEPTLFRSEPTPELFAQMRLAFDDLGGDITRLTNDSYFRNEDIAKQILDEVNLTPVTNSSNKIVETSPLMALIGTMQAIESGTIRHGENVLVAVTGGAKKLKRDFTPKYSLQEDSTPEACIELLTEIGFVHSANSDDDE